MTAQLILTNNELCGWCVNLVFSLEVEQCVCHLCISPRGLAATDKTDGGTASRSDVENTSLYLGNGPNCYRLPLLVATFCRLGKIFIGLLMDIAFWDTQKPNKILTCSPTLCCRCALQDLDLLAPTQCGCGAGCGTDLRARVHQF
jgi:hypothetical protein